MGNYHNPVLLKESVDYLNINPNGTYIDVTFGGGGHAKEILSRLTSKGKLIVFDQDGDAVQNLLKDERLIFIKSNFRYLYRFWKWLDIDQVDGVLADLGVSSYQFDEKERGFSYRFDAELDMRMNQNSLLTASHILNSYDEVQLQRIFSEYGELRNSKTLAREIVKMRKSGRLFDESFQLNALLERLRIGDKFKYFAQVYQALRMEVNDELNALIEMIDASVNIVKPGGRIVVISYHSIEDRVVKRFFKSGNKEGKVQKDEYGKMLSKIKMINNIILPEKEEQNRNARSRSAKMRVAEKIEN